MTDSILSYHEPEDIAEEFLTSAFVICLFQDKILLGFNNWRKQLEVPAGKRELSETISETAKREFFEESHQRIQKPSLLKIVKLKNQDNDIRYRAIFLAKLTELRPYKKEDDDEMDYIDFFKFNSISPNLIDPIDYQILDYFFNDDYGGLKK